MPFDQTPKPTVEPTGCSIVRCGYAYEESNLLRGCKAPPGPQLTGGGILVDSWGWGEGRQRGGEVFQVGDAAGMGIAGKARLPSGDRFMGRKDQALTVLLL